METTAVIKVLLILSCLAPVIHCQDIPGNALDRMKLFFTSIQSQKFEEAADTALKDVKYQTAEDRRRFINALTDAVHGFGPVIGLDIIYINNYSPHLFSVVSIMQLRSRPIYFRFTLFESDQSLLWMSITMDMGLDTMMRDWIHPEFGKKLNIRLPEQVDMP